ncbi:Fimbrial protein precursor [Vibrio coralliirubri]|uniref:pilin n=1 Tax=Vibrio coralliirubri TaxID=1516159 RepID=UPI000639FA66|nr:pilin [Vibrio coralliirubri]CDT20095.1 Fimbrial protein precursor [Vibrio coralliirubri]CDT43383.1 Fimbrial protein precursor [Vibrio coralliirubri]CDT88588.1 Fimbrial protein precursor [Vibrio coralliirubri]CDU03376.1 Fimbrial protein precursor [Vibrio coralliirubri]
MNNKNKRTNQKGFTLIELMIVVAVIGVLAAIAVPQYQKYVAKSEAASALATLTGLKTNAEAYTVENGAFPDAAQSAAMGTPISDMGSIAFARTANTSAGTGTITFTFDGVVSPDLQSQSILLARDQNGAWKCKSTQSMLDSAVNPKGCKTPQ